MSGPGVTFAALVLVLAFAGGHFYRRLWLMRGSLPRVPTGFGAFLAPVMLGGALVVRASGPTLLSLVIVTVATAVYWLDDAILLSARLRLAVAFTAGTGIAACWFLPDHGLLPLVIAALCVAAGIACVGLTQITNFQDGADLNLATFIVLTTGAILLFTATTRAWSAIALVALAFTMAFGVINAKPRMLYLGDSGSFAFAGLLTILAAAFIEGFGNMPPEAAIPAALPALDVAYVFAVRLYEKHDLLTRNYLHLYQRLNRRHAGFAYLLPQFANAGLCLLAAWALQAAGLGRVLSVVIAMAGVTASTYFGCRLLFLAGPAEGALHETVR